MSFLLFFSWSLVYFISHGLKKCLDIKYWYLMVLRRFFSCDFIIWWSEKVFLTMLLQSALWKFLDLMFDVISRKLKFLYLWFYKSFVSFGFIIWWSEFFVFRFSCLNFLIFLMASHDLKFPWLIAVAGAVLNCMCVQYAYSLKNTKLCWSSKDGIGFILFAHEHKMIDGRLRIYELCMFSQAVLSN